MKKKTVGYVPNEHHAKKSGTLFRRFWFKGPHQLQTKNATYILARVRPWTKNPLRNNITTRVLGTTGCASNLNQTKQASSEQGDTDQAQCPLNRPKRNAPIGRDVASVDQIRATHVLDTRRYS